MIGLRALAVLLLLSVCVACGLAFRDNENLLLGVPALAAFLAARSIIRASWRELTHDPKSQPPVRITVRKEWGA